MAPKPRVIYGSNDHLRQGIPIGTQFPATEYPALHRYHNLYDANVAFDDAFQSWQLRHANVSYDMSAFLYRNILDFELTKVANGFYNMTHEEQEQYLAPMWQECEEQFQEIRHAVCDFELTKEWKQFAGPRDLSDRDNPVQIYTASTWKYLSTMFSNPLEVAHIRMYSSYQEPKSGVVNSGHFSVGNWGNVWELEQHWKTIYPELYVRTVQGVQEWHYPPFKPGGNSGKKKRNDRMDSQEYGMGLASHVFFAHHLACDREDGFAFTTPELREKWRLCMLRFLPQLDRYNPERKINLTEGDVVMPSRSAYIAYHFNVVEAGVADFEFSKQIPVITLKAEDFTQDSYWWPQEANHGNMRTIFSKLQTAFPILARSPAFYLMSDSIERANDLFHHPEKFVVGTLFHKLNLYDYKPDADSKLLILPFNQSAFSEKYQGCWYLGGVNDHENTGNLKFDASINDLIDNLGAVNISNVIPSQLRTMLRMRLENYRRAAHAALKKATENDNGEINPLSQRTNLHGREGWFISEEAIAQIEWPNLSNQKSQYKRAYSAIDQPGKFRWCSVQQKQVPHTSNTRNAKQKGKHQTGLLQFAAITPQADAPVQVPNDFQYSPDMFTGGKKGKGPQVSFAEGTPILGRTAPQFSKGVKGRVDDRLKGSITNTHPDMPHGPPEVLEPHRVSQPEPIPQIDAVSFAMQDGHRYWNTSLWAAGKAPDPRAWTPSGAKGQTYVQRKGKGQGAKGGRVDEVFQEMHDRYNAPQPPPPQLHAARPLADRDWGNMSPLADRGTCPIPVYTPGNIVTQRQIDAHRHYHLEMSTWPDQREADTVYLENQRARGAPLPGGEGSYWVNDLMHNRMQ